MTDRPSTPDAAIVTKADFDAVDWKTPLAAVTKACAADAADQFLIALKAAEERNDVEAKRVFQLLFQACNIMLTPDDASEPLQARLVTEMGRSARPSDYRGAQSELFEALMGEVGHPAVRARLADIVWWNDRPKAAAAAVAVDAYCEAMEALGEGRLAVSTQSFAAQTIEQTVFLRRALQIAYATRRNGTIPDRLKALAQTVYERSRNLQEDVAFLEAAKVLAHFDLLPDADLARDAETVADAPHDARLGYAVQGLLAFAAEGYARAKDAQSERRCRLKAVDITLDRARSVTAAIVAAHHLRGAIETLRHIPDTRALRDQLFVELRERQREARDEMPRDRQWMDVSEIAKATLETFGDFDLPEALRHFFCLFRVSDPDTVRQEALVSIRQSFFSGLFGGSHHDGDGKVTAETPPAGQAGAPPEASIDEIVDQHMGIVRRCMVGGAVRPALHWIAERFEIEDRHFWPVLDLSPFVPAVQAPLYAQGFARFMRGDMMAAAHLLLPQLEPSLRKVLADAGHEPSIIRSDMTQEDAMLSALLTTWRPQLEAILGPGLVFEIDVLFHRRPGPALRHEFAHGKITAAACFSPEVVYGCWLILYLAAAPVLHGWDEVIRPAMGWIESRPETLIRRAP